MGLAGGVRTSRSSTWCSSTPRAEGRGADAHSRARVPADGTRWTATAPCGWAPDHPVLAPPVYWLPCRNRGGTGRWTVAATRAPSRAPLATISRDGRPCAAAAFNPKLFSRRAGTSRCRAASATRSLGPSPPRSEAVLSLSLASPFCVHFLRVCSRLFHDYSGRSPRWTEQIHGAVIAAELYPGFRCTPSPDDEPRQQHRRHGARERALPPRLSSDPHPRELLARARTAASRRAAATSCSTMAIARATWRRRPRARRRLHGRGTYGVVRPRASSRGATAAPRRR